MITCKCGYKTNGVYDMAKHIHRTLADCPTCKGHRKDLDTCIYCESMNFCKYERARKQNKGLNNL